MVDIQMADLTQQKQKLGLTTNYRDKKNRL